jgi:hypothetical protein
MSYYYNKINMKKLMLRLLAIMLVFGASCSKEVYLSSEKQITSFEIGTLGAKSKGVIDEVAKKITFEVPYGTDVTKLTPVIAISLSSTVTPSSTVEQDFTKPVTYTVTAEDGTKQAYVVTVIVLKNDENKLLSFKLSGLTPEVVGVINEQSKTVHLVVPINTNIKELVPTITQSKLATVTPATGVKQDFTKPVTYSVAAENGVKQPYVVTVEFEKNSENLITEFKFASLTPAVVATIDQQNSTITATLPLGTDLKALEPTITLSASATVTPAATIKQDFTNMVVYTVVSESGTPHAYKVKVEVSKTKEKKILGFKFAGLNPEVVGVVDEGKKTVLLTVPSTANVTDLVPTIVASPNTKVSPATGEKQDFTKPVTYTVTAEDGTVQDYLVTVTRTKSDEKKLLSFKLSGLTPEVVGVVNEQDKTVRLMVPVNTNVKELVPTITLSKMATVTPATGEKQDFTQPVTYTVAAENGTKQSYVVTVVSEKSSANLITEFKFEGVNPAVVATIDQKNSTITATLPLGTDIKALEPTISLSAMATVTPNSKARQDFTNAVVYTVVSEDGKSHAYTVKVNVATTVDTKIIGFKLAGLTPEVVGVVDEGSKTIVLTVPFGTNLVQLVPTIVASPNTKVTPASGEKQDFTKEVTYTVTANDGTHTDYKVSVVVVKSSAKLITEFKFASSNPVVFATINDVDQTIKALLPPGNDITKLVPTISVSPNATVDPNSGVATDFTSIVTYTVTAQDGTVNPYRVTIDVEKGNQAKILEFKLDELTPPVSAVIDEQAKTIKMVVPYGTDITSLSPTITISSMATVYPRSSWSRDFTKPVIYKVTPEDGDDVEYTATVEVLPFVPAITSVSSTNLLVGQELSIKGNFVADKTTVSLEGATNTVLPIIKKSATDLVVSIPAAVTAGTYKLVVTTNDVKLTYTSDIKVTVSDQILITRIEKTSLVAGIDMITIKGIKLKSDSKARTYIYIGSTKLLGVVNNEGTEVYTFIPLDMPVGAAKVKVSWNEGVYSNELDVNILENTFPKPTISSVSSVDIKAGDKLVVTGTNFMKKYNSAWLIAVIDGKSKKYNVYPTNESETSMTIPTDTVLKAGDYELHIVSNGQEQVYGTKIKISL